MAENDDEKLMQAFYSILTVKEKQNILPDGEGEPYELSFTCCINFLSVFSHKDAPKLSFTNTWLYFVLARKSFYVYFGRLTSISVECD